MKKTLLIIIILLGILSGLNSVPRELVVVEIATGTWCQHCPGASMGAHDLLTNGIAVAVVKNHNQDSFANTASNARNNYYAVNGYPTSLFDGLNRYSGGSNTQSLYSTFLPRVNARLAVPSHYTINASGAHTGNNYMVVVNIDKPEEDTNTNVVLHSALTQSNIAMNWQGQTQVNNAMRLMAPDHNGTPVDLATGEQTSIPLNFTIQSSWPVQNLELVLWLQNTVTKEILQGKKYALNAIAAGASVQTDFMMFPYISVNSTTTKQLVLANYSSSTVTGNINIDNPVFTSSATNFSIPPTSIQIVEIGFNPTQALSYEGFMTVTGNFMDSQEFLVILNGMAFTNTAPTASEVVQTGIPVLHQTLNGGYVFTDPENHDEGSSLMKWYQIIDGTPILINGANELDYQITVNDVGANIAFEVTPVDIHGFAGTPVMSSPSAVVIDLPIPQNFNAVVDPPNTVICTWQKPQYYDTRGLLGYKLYRNDLNVATITNPNTLTFTDTFLDDGTYEYKICSMFQNPYYLSDPSPVVTVIVGNTANDDEIASLEQKISVNPNPFSTNTTFSVSLKAIQPTSLNIYNVKGQLVRSLLVSPNSKGTATVKWDGKTDNGLTAMNGIYFYSIGSGNDRLTGKLMIVK
ncbi:MAG: FlgD immunoglobulin-like domain containing protein [Candidatus Cloacimonetes bacterium]|nr:FlgD immunoglobulin-like domain containing protein [Candidatus Cloacimonadota bacterium]